MPDSSEQSSDLAGALEAVIFASGEPLTLNELKKIFERFWRSEPEETRKERVGQIKDSLAELKARWGEENGRGFVLVEVAEGWGFRSNPAHADVLRAMREERPIRLSRAALETLAIVAYRQPVTKPEIDHIRGVDCGGTIRLLLDRDLIRIVGKKEEPGRPMLYGTTREFLSFFNLGSLSQLPTLREFHELNEEFQEELDTFDSHSLKDLSDKAKQIGLGEEPAVEALDEAMENLKSTEQASKDALDGEGVHLEAEDQAAPEPPKPEPVPPNPTAS